MGEPRQSGPDVVDELTAICNSMGKLDENDGTYMKDRDCKICLKEIMRFLNADTKLRLARITLGNFNIIKHDLIPLMVQECDYHDGDEELFNLCIKICANLTSSALLLFENQELPTDPEDLKLYHKLLGCLYNYKEAFASDEKIWILLNTYLNKLMVGDKDDHVFERIIILIRNILHIPVDSTADMGCHSEFDAHDMCLYRMDKSGMLDTLIRMASETDKGTEYCFHLMEIIYLMLRDQNPETIAKSRPFTLKRKLDEEDPDKKRLAELSARNRRDRETRKTNIMEARFRNTLFQARNYRSLGESPMIVKKPLCSLETMEFDEGKTQLRKAKNRKPLSSETSMMISDTNKNSSKTGYGLKVFCQRFVEQVYSNYMQQIKHNLIQKKTQDNDESYYLWSIQYFTAFNRHMNLPLDNISETLSSSSLHYIQILISTFQDKLKIEKKKFQDISKRLHLAVRAYREILDLLRFIKPDSEFSRVAETMKRNIFTETEYSTLMLTLFQGYEEPKHSEHYLTDLILTNDIFLGLLEEFSRTHTSADIEEILREDENEEGDEQDPKEGEQRESNEGGSMTNDEASVKKPAAKSKKKKKQAIEFKTAHFMNRYCCPVVLCSYFGVLKSFKTNDTNINLAILKFLERIVFDCKNQVILLQASVLKCLLEIMSYHSTFPGKDRFDCLTQNLVQTFGSMANKKRWMYQELLFWKSGTDVLEIENAIDPPPPVLPEHREIVDDEEMDMAANSEPIIPEQSQENEEARAASLAELMAELHDSSDDDDVGDIGASDVAVAPDAYVTRIDSDESNDQSGLANGESQCQVSSQSEPDESVARLLADIGSDSESDFGGDELPELSDCGSSPADDNSSCRQIEPDELLE